MLMRHIFHEASKNWPAIDDVAFQASKEFNQICRMTESLSLCLIMRDQMDMILSSSPNGRLTPYVFLIVDCHCLAMIDGDI